MPAGGGDEEGTRGMGERRARAGGGAVVSSGGRGETRGGEETTGGGREEMAGRGCPRGGMGTEGAGVAARQVAGGVPVAPMEGGETEGGRHGRAGAMPRLPVEEDGIYLGVSTLYYYFFLIFLTIFLGKEGRSARPAPLPNGSVQWWEGTPSRCPGRRWRMWRKGAAAGRVEEEGGGGNQGRVWVSGGRVVGTSSKEVGGVGVVAGAEVGRHDSNFRAHCRQCVRFVGWVGAGGEGEGEGDRSRDGCGGDGNGGDRRGRGGGGVGGDGCGDGEGRRWRNGGGGDIEGGREISG